MLPLFLKDLFLLDIKFLVDRFPPTHTFPHFKYVISLLLASVVSVEKLADSLPEDLLIMMSCFSLAFKILLSFVFNSLNVIYESESLYMYSSWGLLSFSDMWIHVFCQI